jgi:FtsZ-interacting cell division protein ZipA
MSEVSQVASSSVELWQVVVFLVVAIGLIVAGVWLGRMAAFRPEKFKSFVETPLDKAAQALADKGWTSAQIDEVLTGWANRDLTAKVADAYQGLPPDVLAAAQKIADYAAKQKGSKG